MTLYETLGVPQDASLEEIRRSYLAKLERLRPSRYGGAGDEVHDALRRATDVVDGAWRVLGDDASRAEYDLQLAESAEALRTHAEHVWVMERELGWTLSPAFGLSPPGGPADAAPRAPQAGGAVEGGKVPGGLAGPASMPSRDGRLSPFLAGLEALADWLAPHPRASRTVTVPDVRGMRASDAFYAVAVADLHIDFVRLTEDIAGGDGLVVDQDPAPGDSVRRDSTLTVHVVFPADGDRPGLP